MMTLEQIGKKAKAAERFLAKADAAQKTSAIESIADELIKNTDKIIESNKIDLENGKNNGLSDSLLDRLALTPERIKGMAQGAMEVAAMNDPVGKVLDGGVNKNGMTVTKITVPLGVIAVIFEARPNVTSDAAVLCLKAGNTVILRGGKEAINSNIAIVEVMRNAVEKAGLPADCIQLIEDTSRDSARGLMTLNEYVDVLIPRGGAGLIRTVVENSTVPVIETGSGNCHTYIDKDADIDMAAEIIFNAKTSRPSVCNACESVLIHKDIAEIALIAVAKKLEEKNVEIHGDEIVCAILPDAIPATENDWATEYLDYKISIKTVDSIDEAIDHISKYSTRHSECIITNNLEASQKFIKEVDSAAVYVNVSTRFTDGGEFGYGAEIGISTQKLHARGPLGIDTLVSYKYTIIGNGQIRK
ncbi:MAG: glutamate-5-semialdehyde dehydrogenase [Clostridia bacterium]|nr:glutamate-5-semialdehyde dehydrogenase [Clostridia bacterium]